jgi:hypothetical protein
LFAPELDYNDLTFSNGQIEVANPSKNVFKLNYIDSKKDVVQSQSQSQQQQQQQSQKQRVQQQRERQEIIHYEPDILFSIDDMLLQNQQTSNLNDDKISTQALDTPLVDPTQFTTFEENDFIINDDFIDQNNTQTISNNNNNRTKSN